MLSALLVMTEAGFIRDRRCSDALDLLEQKRLPDGTFPVEWTNVEGRHHRKPRNLRRLGPLSKRRGNPLVTVDALRILNEAGGSV